MGRALWASLAVLAAASPPAADAAFPDGAPNDPLFDASPLPNSREEQWNLVGPEDGFDRGISVDRAWPLTTGRGVTIADIDLGVQFGHEDLRGRWAINAREAGRRGSNGRDDDGNRFVDDRRGWDFYAFDKGATSDIEENHGTRVAGVLGAATDNGRGVAGVAPSSRILALRSADNILHQGSRLAEAIVYAADNGADVMSMSLGAESMSAALRRAVAYAHRKGVVMVAAMGNELAHHHNFPATFNHVIAVGGVNPDTANEAALQPSLTPVATDFKVHASYSDFGPQIDVVAPTQVPTTDWGGGYLTNWSGTSASTPHVAGVAALVMARAKELDLRLGPGEVRQIIRGTAEDLSAPDNGRKPGWDQLTGWGRINAYDAVRSVKRGRIPPDTDITSPEWFATETGKLRVRGRVGGHSDTRWRLEIGAGEEPESWRRIASGRSSSGRRLTLARLDAAKLGSGGQTLRLSTRDGDGNRGVDRAHFFANHDRTLATGFPKALRTSGEASPTLADLSGDGTPEILLATSDGQLRAYSGSGGRSLPCWPQRSRRAPGSAPAERRIGRIGSALLATPAVGDIAGGRRPEIIQAALDGRVHAWTPRGKPVDGFPVAIDARRPPRNGRQDSAIYASPALADLRGDRRLEIVVGAADQKVYAWKGSGRRLPGWPVRARDGDDRAKILSSPAIGDIDGDGKLDVVEGTAETYGSTPDQTGRVYAFSSRGKLLPGWPVRPSGLSVNSIPLVGEGVPASPSLADVDGDGDDEVAISAFTGQPELYRGDGSRLPGPGPSHFQSVGKGPASRSTASSILTLGGNGAFGRTSRNGPLRFFSGVVDTRFAAAASSPSQKLPFEHLLGGWDARSGAWLGSFPAPVEGLQILATPAIADVDGDGQAEVIAGTSEYKLHAFRTDGTEPPGWPKQTGGWLLASPAVGDVDGDRRLEVVAVTREGNLFVWDTPARSSAPAEWPSFRHDVRNSGRYSPRPTAAAARRFNGCEAASTRRFARSASVR